MAVEIPDELKPYIPEHVTVTEVEKIDDCHYNVKAFFLAPVKIILISLDCGSTVEIATREANNG